MVVERRNVGNDTGVATSRLAVATLSERFRRLHNLLTENFPDVEAHAAAYLQAGLEFFSAESGIICQYKSASSDLLVEYATGPHFKSGELLDASVGWSNFTITQKKIQCVNDSNGNLRGLSYNGPSIRAYVCAPLLNGDRLYGVLGFFVSDNRQRTFNADDVSTVELMAKGVAKMIELQKKVPEGNARFPSGFATEGVKAFEDYVEQARIPEAYGVPGRVVEVLQRRIGNSSLSIDHIADEMNLSKRTLQRRLQQQNISFAQLRDQVRFHHSVNYLVENTMSIDSISSSLDFSDRTSFTNAFKRWTGLSPSTFRKLFRDYV